MKNELIIVPIQCELCLQLTATVRMRNLLIYRSCLRASSGSLSSRNSATLRGNSTLKARCLKVRNVQQLDGTSSPQELKQQLQKQREQEKQQQSES